MISKNYFTLPFYVPRIISMISNWPLYFFNYLSRRKQPAEYVLRNGYKLIDSRGTIPGTIAVVFIRQEYGPLQDYKTILDIGANMGCFAVYAALACPNAEIYCFEPEERNFGNLKMNININSLDKRVHAINCAVASSTGSRELVIGESPLNSLVTLEASGSRQTVNCVTLRDIFRENKLESVDLVKMNCEGAEYEIFEGCTTEDFERMPRIRVEYHNLDNEKQTGEWLAKYLESHGYQIEHFTRYLEESGFIWALRK
jgi:FkbM family methyltransferase